MFSGRMKSANVLNGSEKTDLSLSSVKNNGIARNRNRCYLLRSVNRNLNSSILFAFYVSICFFFLACAFIRTLAARAVLCHIRHMCVFIISIQSLKSNARSANETDNHWFGCCLIRLRNFITQNDIRGINTENDQKKININFVRNINYLNGLFCLLPMCQMMFCAPPLSIVFFLPYEIILCALARNEYPNDPPF